MVTPANGKGERQMNMDIEKAKELAKDGKDAVALQLNRLSRKADAIPLLKGSRRNKIIALAGIAVLAFALISMMFGGGGESGAIDERFPNTPEGICERFVDALRRKDVDAILDASMIYVTPLKPMAFSQMPEEARAELKANAKAAYMKLNVVKYDGELSTDVGGNIEADVILEKDGKEFDYPLFAREVDGVWKIDIAAFEERRGCR